MAKPKKRESPRACPKCGTCAIEKTAKDDKQGVSRPWFRCLREDCKHEASRFPTVAGLASKPNQMNPKGSQRGMAPGGYMVRPTGNKYS